MSKITIIVALVFLLTIGGVSAGSDFANTEITCNDSEQTLRDKDTAGITFDGLHVYVGYRQITGINQNPVVTAFSALTGERVFCREDYEQAGVDGRARGVHTDGTSLYVYFSLDGGITGGPLLSAANGNQQNWTRSVGAGASSGNFAVVARIDPTAGDVTGAAFLTAVLNNGNPNSLGVDGFQCTVEGRVRVRADSFFGPRRVNGSRMTQTGGGSSPFDYTVDLTADLEQVTYAFAPQWQADGTSATVTACPNSALGSIGVPLAATDVVADGRITPRDVVFVVNRVGQSPNGGNGVADVDQNGAITEADINLVIDRLGIQLP